MNKLTKKRAEIITGHFYPFLQANIETGDGDLYDGGLNEYSSEDINAALDWLWEQAHRRQNQPKSWNRQEARRSIKTV